MTKILYRLGQGWHVVVLARMYARIALLVGVYTLEKVLSRTVAAAVNSGRALNSGHRQRRR